MQAPNPLRVFLFLGAVLVVMGGMELAKGGIYLSKHEGDTLHLLDILTRMTGGARIHRDFHTPIGVAAFAPIVLFAKAGLPYGHALLWGQLLASALMVPAIWWVVWTRLSGFWAYLGGLYMVMLPMALSYGGDDGAISMSMHYNRWAWASAYLAVLPSLLPSRRPGGWMVDGLVIGLALATLALTKVTYFPAIALPVALALLMRRQRGVFGVAVVAGLAVVAGMTAWGGIGYWQAYLDDLRQVAASESRPYPGEPFGKILGGSAFLGATLAALFSVVILRQAQRQAAGLVMLLLTFCFAWITYQNYGNDPQWLILLALLLIALRPGPDLVNDWGWNLRRCFDGTALVALALAAPPFFNLAYSPWRHLGLAASGYAPLTPLPAYSDVLTAKERAYLVSKTQSMMVPGGMLAVHAGASDEDYTIAVNGETLPDCELANGIVGWYEAIARDLSDAGYAGKAIYMADLLSVLPLYGPFPSLDGGAPWYYGGAPGVAAAEYVLVADCPLSRSARKAKLEALTEAGYGLTERRRTELYRLYRIAKP